jgi:hypothetical protein
LPESFAETLEQYNDQSKESQRAAIIHVGEGDDGSVEMEYRLNSVSATSVFTLDSGPSR